MVISMEALKEKQANRVGDVELSRQGKNVKYPSHRENLMHNDNTTCIFQIKIQYDTVISRNYWQK